MRGDARVCTRPMEQDPTHRLAGPGPTIHEQNTGAAVRTRMVDREARPTFWCKTALFRASVSVGRQVNSESRCEFGRTVRLKAYSGRHARQPAGRRPGKDLIRCGPVLVGASGQHQKMVPERPGGFGILDAKSIRSRSERPNNNKTTVRDLSPNQRRPTLRVDAWNRA